jgi:hypothetical protein
MGPTLVGKGCRLQTGADGSRNVFYHLWRSQPRDAVYRRGMNQDEMLRIVAYVRTLDK